MAVTFAALLVGGCTEAGGTYTLYRNSIIAGSRVHVATFDTSEGEAYNAENCQSAARLFQAQPGIVTRFWCEKGRYKS